MNATMLISVVLIACLLAWPDQTLRELTIFGFKIQVWWLNLRIKFAAWQMHRSLVKMCKQNGFPAPGPFRFVDIWDREPLD